jgi:hypothetical protein
MFGDVFGNRQGELLAADDGDESQTSWDPLREPILRPGRREFKYGECANVLQLEWPRMHKLQVISSFLLCAVNACCPLVVQSLVVKGLQTRTSLVG